MLINVADLLKEPVGATRRYKLEDELTIDGGGPDRFESITGRVKMLRTDRGILVEAYIHGYTVAVCSRCVSSNKLVVSTTIEEEFYPTNLFRGTQQVAYPDHDPVLDGENFFIDDRNVLDLTEAARQALVSSKPMAPLCRPDCRGICPQCTIDRNFGGCSC